MTDVGMEAITGPYYEALARGEFLIQHCKACGRNNMYPRHLCPFCHEDQMDWVTSAGTGVLHSFAVHRIGPPSGFEDDVPYSVGVVKLDDDVQVLGRLWPDDGGDWGSYACDAAVEFHSASAEEMTRRPVPWFRLAAR